MTEERKNEPTVVEALDEPVPTPQDPGGAHAKGYSAEPGSAPPVPEGPIPLAEGPDTHPAFSVPERDNDVRPTGREEPGEYTPNKRLMGSDR
jgi:hypothetical protein